MPKISPILSGSARQKRLDMILPHARGRILDIGCGFSKLPDMITDLKSYTGLDNHPSAPAYFENNYPQHSFFRCNLEDEPLDFLEGPFDTIILTAIVEHLHHPERVLSQVQTLLEPGGRLLITTPSPFGDLLHQVGSRLGLFYAEKVVQHVQIFNLRRLETLVSDSGYQVLDARTFVFGANLFVMATR
jgi:SAM-dependent methyltransferase